MALDAEHKVPSAGWRSSTKMIMGTACGALFTETLLSGFPVPMLPYMLEERLHNDPSQTLETTNRLLSIHALVAMVCSPVFAKFFDKYPGQKVPLYLSLGLCLAGTAMVACPIRLWALYIGRAMQAAAGSAAWLICPAMITKYTANTETGTVMGITTSCAMIGTASGPMLGGVLLDWFGYWGAWSMPISLLFLDMIARMIMIEPPRDIVHDSTVSSSNDDENRPGQPRHDSEISPLLPTPPPVEVISGDTAEAGSNGNAASGNGSRNFYALLLQNTGVWASILCTMYQPAIRASFNATLPIHLRDTFHWSPSSIGAVFFCLHFPVVFLSPFIGRIRDRVGIRGPTALGCVLLCPFLCCLGFAGNKTSLIGGSEKTKEAIFITCICGIGLILPFLQGAGALYILNTVKRMEEETPKIFGPHGGRARCFAMGSVAFYLGMMLGPVMVGWLYSGAGYMFMNVVFGAIALVVAIIVFVFL